MTRTRTSKTGTSAGRWLKGCGIGCGIVAVLVILSFVGGAFVMMRPFREAVEIRDALVERHGGVDDFTPWPDGGIPPDRMEAFLHVRRAVQEGCGEIGTTDAGIEAMDRLDDQENPSNVEILRAFGEASKSVLGMGTAMGELFRVRNAALLEMDMGLGEYTYIYAAAYGPQIMGPPSDDNGEGETTYLSSRVRETLRRQLRNRLAAMDERPESWDDSEERGLLVEEITILEDHPGRLPWRAVRPPSLLASLAPYEDQLAALFCPEATHLELTRNRSTGLGIQGD